MVVLSATWLKGFVLSARGVLRGIVDVIRVVMEKLETRIVFFASGALNLLRE